MPADDLGQVANRPQGPQTGLWETSQSLKWIGRENPQIALVGLPTQVANDKGRYHSLRQARKFRHIAIEFEPRRNS